MMKHNTRVDDADQVFLDLWNQYMNTIWDQYATTAPGIWINDRLAVSPAGTQCKHEWVETPGFSRVYSDCKHCGMHREDSDE